MHNIRSCPKPGVALVFIITTRRLCAFVCAACCLSVGLRVTRSFIGKVAALLFRYDGVFLLHFFAIRVGAKAFWAH